MIFGHASIDWGHDVAGPLLVVIGTGLLAALATILRRINHTWKLLVAQVRPNGHSHEAGTSDMGGLRDVLDVNTSETRRTRQAVEDHVVSDEANFAGLNERMAKIEGQLEARAQLVDLVLTHLGIPKSER